MKAILEFTLPDDEEEYKIMNNAKIYYNSLWDIREKIRCLLKHGPPQNDCEQILENLRQMIPYEALD